MTGDKRADYVAIDPDNGALTLWNNRCLPQSTTPVETGPIPVEGCDPDNQNSDEVCINEVPVNFIGSTCDGRRDLIKTEMAWAYGIALAASENPQRGNYFDVCVSIHPFSESERKRRESLFTRDGILIPN